MPVSDIRGINMKFDNALKLATVGVVCMSLSACFGNGNTGVAGGLGGPPGGSNFQTNFDAAAGTLATTTELTGSADYTGEVRILTGLNAGDASEALIGDLDMNVNFDANSRPVTATASGFAGEINGTQVTVDGTLSTDNAPNGINDISATNVTVPVQGQITLTAVSVEMQGSLSESTNQISGDALLTLQGQFRGDNGASVLGAAGVIYDPTNGPRTITGGDWYANRD